MISTHFYDHEELLLNQATKANTTPQREGVGEGGMQITLQNSKQRAPSEAPELDSLFMFCAHFQNLKGMQAMEAK